MTVSHLTDNGAARSPSEATSVRLRRATRPSLLKSMRTGAFFFGFFGLVGSMLTAPTAASAAPFRAAPFPPGSIVVSQGGTIAAGEGGTAGTVAADGEVNVYPPNSDGDVTPLASFTKGMNGPFTVRFDPSGDLWAANVNNNTLVEFTSAQLATPNPSPAVTISLALGTGFPSNMAFDRSGNLWVVNDYAPVGGEVYEYANWQLASSGSPTPVATISDIPSIPGGIGFDPWGNLWVPTQTSGDCPQACLVEFPKDELGTPDPAPTVIISSTGGPDISFTSSGDMWMVTGGGPPPDTLANCFGSPCNNELVELTKGQLASSGSPTPAITIRSNLPWCSVPAAPSIPCVFGSMYGPYGVAVDARGDVWVSNYNKPTTVEYSADQLSHSGSPTPLRTIAGPNTGMNWPSFVVLAP